MDNHKKDSRPCVGSIHLGGVHFCDSERQPALSHFDANELAFLEAC
jgi:hypothetical protein